MPYAMVNPLLPLDSGEIQTVASLVRQHAGSNLQLHFKTITIEEPHRDDVQTYIEAKKKGLTPGVIERVAFVTYYIKGTDIFYEALVSISQNAVLRATRLPPQYHANIDENEMIEIADLALKHEKVQAALTELQLPAGYHVVIEPWMYGSDGVNDSRRCYQCFMFIRDPANSSEPDSNYYAYPLPISAVMDAVTRDLIRVDRIPTGGEYTVGEMKPYKVHRPAEYLPELQDLRQDVKPLQVVQPDGVSFAVTSLGETGHYLEWQKWAFQIGFNAREGIVSYDGRQVFYRLALSEMNVPYGDPRAPLHRKAAFDLGDAGAGATANNLQLGCDCLGSIQYLTGIISDSEGRPEIMPNAICIHEQDNGISWKHTNWRTGRACVVRNRELVLQSILTLANYEYILAFVFNQAGEMHYEVRAMGIVSTQPVDEGINSPHGTVVHPGVLAAYHQHVFSLRIDPAVDGPHNRVVYEEAHAMPRDEVKNPHGVGYILEKTTIDVAGGYDLDHTRNRTFKIVNDKIRNPVNNLPVGYKIHAAPFQAMLADKDSFHFKRAEFADHHIYITKYAPNEKFAGGKYTNQSRGGDGVRTWSARKDNVKDTTIVVWVQFGINHIPRVEDFPVCY
ncbi:Amine oxidase [Diaporthe amygdali]|uniref:Amine oxidase n=1 Tax=Phomopsis amygdali TaxID=1214568 RepID=UPI0022FE728E|nr:Amine oxidase [Diaporthe amygdali]KAJ0110303.1 Amine oxidase [Diaporthe amygdali]